MTDETIDIYIEADGTAQAVYSDALPSAFDRRDLSVRRASHVEPHPDGGWYADMQPVGGPVLGYNEPFPTRAEALEAERRWLDAEMQRRRV